MKILICPDKFKGSLTAREVCDAITAGLHEIDSSIIAESIPLADGGEGTCALLTEWHGGSPIGLEVHDPLFKRREARYGISADGSTAFIEMAEASGLTLLKPEERDPLVTTSLGTGELIADALTRGVRKIILGIGGSATNDAGIGMASALGFEFYGSDGEILKPTGENLIHLRYIKTEGIHPLLKETEVTALCDVTNPLYGIEGAAQIYGPQKGANKAAVDLLDAGLRNFRRVVHKYLRTSVDFPGAGAAGGLGAGARVFLNATIQRGVNYMIESTGLQRKIKWADLIITGEGKIDTQTFSGKVVSQILDLARDARKPVIVVCGECEVPRDEIRRQGIRQLITLAEGDTTRESAIQNAAKLVTRKINEGLKNLPSL